MVFITMSLPLMKREIRIKLYLGVDKSLARPTSRCILFVGENISFDASLVLYIYIYIYIVKYSSHYDYK
jgi:hypothetical protein